MSQSNDGKPAARRHDSLFRGRFQRLLIAEAAILAAKRG
jgi:hypothetical protein